MLGLFLRVLPPEGGLRVDVLLPVIEFDLERRAGDAVEGLLLPRGARLLRAAADVGRTPRFRRRRSTSLKPKRVFRLSKIGCDCEGATA